MVVSGISDQKGLLARQWPIDPLGSLELRLGSKKRARGSLGRGPLLSLQERELWCFETRKGQTPLWRNWVTSVVKEEKAPHQTGPGDDGDEIVWDSVIVHWEGWERPCSDCEMNVLFLCASLFTQLQ